MAQENLHPPELIVQDLSNIKLKQELGRYLPSQGFTSKYDSQNQFLAIGCNNGMKLLFSIKDRKLLSKTQCAKQTPVTTVKWRPMNNTKTKVLGVGNADGVYQYWHVPSMKKLFSIQENQNSIHCSDFTKTGQHFATAGKDCNIRIYDENTKSISTTFGAAQWNYRGHSNRIFSVKFIDENVLVSGGWDSVIHQWDIRVGKSVRSFYGPHVAGDSIDFKNNQLLIGCYAAKNQIQIWDYRKFQQKQAITWTSIEDKDKVAYVYSTCFIPGQKNSILAGACGINEIKLFTKQNQKYVTQSRIYDLKHGCFSVDHNWKSNQFCFTTAHDGFYIYSYS